jgi:hypothetical protein
VCARAGEISKYLCEQTRWVRTVFLVIVSVSVLTTKYREMENTGERGSSSCAFLHLCAHLYTVVHTVLRELNRSRDTACGERRTSPCVPQKVRVTRLGAGGGRDSKNK